MDSRLLEGLGLLARDADEQAIGMHANEHPR